MSEIEIIELEYVRTSIWGKNRAVRACAVQWHLYTLGVCEAGRSIFFVVSLSRSQYLYYHYQLWSATEGETLQRRRPHRRRRRSSIIPKPREQLQRHCAWTTW